MVSEGALETVLITACERVHAYGQTDVAVNPESRLV